MPPSIISEVWHPAAAPDVVRFRAELLARLRGYFTQQGVMEVDTPALSPATITDPHLHSFSLDTATGRRYLHTSPEFPMKRLLAAGSGDIYQICKVFRADEAGRFHNPEFTLLEWYRLGFDQYALMDDVDALLFVILHEIKDLQQSVRMSYRDAFVQHAGLDPLTASLQDCESCARDRGVTISGELDYDQWLDLILTHVVARAFTDHAFTFIYDYPPSQAALATVRNDASPVAERFEVFWGRMEIANGFHELTDAQEQRRRFEAELNQREVLGLPPVPMDHKLLAALQAGLPDCSGVALGVDRLLMLALGVDDIREVLGFPWGIA